MTPHVAFGVTSLFFTRPAPSLTAGGCGFEPRRPRQNPLLVAPSVLYTCRFRFRRAHPFCDARGDILGTSWGDLRGHAALSPSPVSHEARGTRCDFDRRFGKVGLGPDDRW